MRWLNWRVSQTGPSAWVWPTSQRLSSETWTRFILFPQWSRWCKFFHSFIFHCLICLCRLWCNPNSHQVRVRYDLVNFLNVLQGHMKNKNKHLHLIHTWFESENVIYFWTMVSIKGNSCSEYDHVHISKIPILAFLVHRACMASIMRCISVFPACSTVGGCPVWSTWPWQAVKWRNCRLVPTLCGTFRRICRMCSRPAGGAVALFSLPPRNQN